MPRTAPQHVGNRLNSSLLADHLWRQRHHLILLSRKPPRESNVTQQEWVFWVPGESGEWEEAIDGADDASLKQIIPTLADGIHLATPVFDGAKEIEIKDLLIKAGLPTRGQTTLFDGRTGVPFDNQVTVGVMYMVKLHHLVEEKIHARSIGP